MLQILTRMTIPLCLILYRLYLLLSYCCCISEFAHNCIVYPFLVRYLSIRTLKGRVVVGNPSWQQTVQELLSRVMVKLVIKTVRNPFFYYSSAKLSINGCLLKFFLKNDEEWKLWHLQLPLLAVAAMLTWLQCIHSSLELMFIRHTKTLIFPCSFLM